MLYGIGKPLQQQLVQDGYRVRVYVSYGPSWYPVVHATAGRAACQHRLLPAPPAGLGAGSENRGESGSAANGANAWRADLRRCVTRKAPRTEPAAPERTRVKSASPRGRLGRTLDADASASATIPFSCEETYGWAFRRHKSARA